MTKDLDDYGPTAGEYKGGSGANLNEQGGNKHLGGNGGNAGNNSNNNNSTKINIPNGDAYMTMCSNNLSENEGYINKMNKDSLGKITVGIGHLLSNADIAAALPFFETSRVSLGHAEHDIQEVAVSKEKIKEAFNSFKADSKLTPSMYLKDKDIVSLCIKDVELTETGLRSLYSQYDTFSNSRKTALVDMGFNLGISGLKTNFSKFNDAVNREDWGAAAKESHRVLNQKNDDRNKKTASQLRDDK